MRQCIVVVIQSLASKDMKYGSRAIYGIESHYQATTGEGTADLMCAVMNCKACELEIVL
jgi:hypothetical protein